MEEFFGFRNFRQFERTRGEIRLPYDLLNDLRFRQLPDAHKAHLICLLLLCARMHNLLPNSPLRLERLIGATEPLDLSALAPFVDFTEAEKPAWEDRLVRHEQSGLSAPAFCTQEGLSLPAFHSWRRRLRPHTPAAAETPLVGLRLLAAPPPVELLLPTGVLLRLPAGCDLALVHSLLALLAEDAPC